jgi:hypothetical protein
MTITPKRKLVAHYSGDYAPKFAGEGTWNYGQLTRYTPESLDLESNTRWRGLMLPLNVSNRVHLVGSRTKTPVGYELSK